MEQAFLTMAAEIKSRMASAPALKAGNQQVHIGRAQAVKKEGAGCC